MGHWHLKPCVRDPLWLNGLRLIAMGILGCTVVAGVLVGVASPFILAWYYCFVQGGHCG